MSEEHRDGGNAEHEPGVAEDAMKAEADGVATTRPTAEAAADVMPRLKERLKTRAAAVAEAASMKDAALRAQAEVENIRRRATRDVEAAHKFALEKFASALLPVADGLQKSVEAVGAHEGDDEGLAAVKRHSAIRAYVHGYAGEIRC